ncbi:MAG TPA: class I SAM-dependent methyltransferase [Kiritimatiellia bacterium]|nr:class I SAM-dependent methyltransferase [Kiritimatiellia bacterium]
MAKLTPFDWYETPVYYDMIFDVGSERETAFLVGAWQRHHRLARVPDPLYVLEPACGSGRLMGQFHRQGWIAHGFDAHPGMIDYAERRLAVEGCGSVRVWPDRMEAFTPPNGQRYALAHCLVSTFKYLLTEEEAQAHLHLVAEALLPGGLYLLGVHLTDYSRTVYEHERWTASRDGVDVVCNIRGWPPDRKQRTEEVRSRLKVIKGGHPPQHYETSWTFRTYNAAQLKRTVREGAPGLEVAACYDFRYDLAAPRRFDDEYADILLVLRKKI